MALRAASVRRLLQSFVELLCAMRRSPPAQPRRVALSVCAWARARSTCVLISTSKTTTRLILAYPHSPAMTTHLRSSSSGREAPYASTSALPPTTPRRKIKRKSAVPLSNKQYDRMTRQLLHIQRGRGKDSSLAEADEEGENEDVNSHSHTARVFSALDLNSDAPVDSDSTMALGHARPATTSTKESTKYWLDRVSNARSTITRNGGKGPDGIALAVAAAKGLQGKGKGGSGGRPETTLAC